jgi:RNA polymerase sigma factor (sigma-70 family)
MRNDEFERLYEEEAPALFSFLAYRTGDRALAQDLLGDTFERALRARLRFDRRKGSERTWLYTIGLNVLRDHARRNAAERRAHERVISGGGATQEGAEDPRLPAVGDRDELTRALAGLSAEEREVISLRFGADLTSPEIARVLKTKLTTVEGRLYRALRKLRVAIEADQDASRYSSR